MRTRSILVVVVALGAALVSAVAVAGKYDPRATMSGVGPIRIGMSERQLEDALQMRLPDTQDAAEDSCRQVEAGPRWPGTSVMLLDGRVARIDISRRGVPTLSGALVGDLVSRVYDIYGRRLRATQHDFGAGEGMEYLTMFSSDHHYGIRFETDGERVTEFYVGTSEAVQFIEGCL
jgi:hypothetical protein